MKLNKVKIGNLIEQILDTNSDLQYGEEDVKGMTIYKEIIPTKADTNGTDLSKYIIIKPNEFIYNPRTHGKRIGLGFNNTNKTIIISWNNIGFRIKQEKKNEILPYYLFMNFNRDEWDREACFQSWGSSTEVFGWNILCDMEIYLPNIDIQQKYVDIYKSMIENQKSYEKGLEDLKLTCDVYIENLRKNVESEEIGRYIRECDEKNKNLLVTLNQGIDVNMQFITAKREAEDKENNRIVRNGQFAFNKVVKSNGTKLPIALRDGDDCIISNSYQVFEVSDKEHLIPEYLMMWMSRSETQRLCGFNAWGSTRDVFPFEELKKLRFPIPNIEIQSDVINIYKVYKIRKEINEKLKNKIKELCPILIKGSIEEAKLS